MIMWSEGNTATAIPKWSSMYIQAGSGFANRTSNNSAMYTNSTPEQFAKNGIIPQQASGVFGLSTAQHANVSGESVKVQSAGWNLREAFEGPIVSVGLSTATATSANGEQVVLSNGTVNAVASLVTNSSGNGVSLVFTGYNFNNGGRFVNGSIVAAPASAFIRNLHLLSITAVATGSSGYTNGDIVIAANGLINGYGTITTSSSGNLASVALGTNATGLGLWANNVANNVVTFSVPNPANSSATGGSFTANLVTSTGGVVNLSTIVMGGRAGRVQYECLVGMGSLSPGNNTILPN